MKGKNTTGQLASRDQAYEQCGPSWISLLWKYRTVVENTGESQIQTLSAIKLQRLQCQSRPTPPWLPWVFYQSHHFYFICNFNAISIWHHPLGLFGSWHTLLGQLYPLIPYYILIHPVGEGRQKDKRETSATSLMKRDSCWSPIFVIVTALHLWLYPQVTGKGMGDIDGANYSPGWGSWNVSQAGSLF